MPVPSRPATILPPWRSATKTQWPCAAAPHHGFQLLTMSTKGGRSLPLVFLPAFLLSFLLSCLGICYVFWSWYWLLNIVDSYATTNGRCQFELSTFGWLFSSSPDEGRWLEAASPLHLPWSPAGGFKSWIQWCTEKRLWKTSTATKCSKHWSDDHLQGFSFE